MKQKIHLVRIVVLISFLTLAAPAFLSPVFAQSGNNTNTGTNTGNQTTVGGATVDIECSGEIVAGVCVPETGLPDTKIEDILFNFMQWILAIFGFLAIITFVIAGIQYFMAAGNPDVAKKAKNHMVYSIIGILVALSGYIVILAVAGFLAGDSSF
jgi:hypothetical protein